MSPCDVDVSVDMQLVVKNTFIEFTPCQTQLARSRSAPPVRTGVRSASVSSASTDVGGDSDASAGSSAEHHAGGEWRTTVMLRNLPNNYSRDMLLDHLDEMGFSGLYDFFYLPMDFSTQACYGFAFVNMSSPAHATSLAKAFEGFSKWSIPSRKLCKVSWSDPHQGLRDNIERYRNSPVMHIRVPDAYKPMLFLNGAQVSFPRPTKKKLRCPKMNF